MRNVNVQQVGLTVWRIEKFLVKAWDRSKYGKFFDGDSYIILNTYNKATHSGKGKGAVAWDIHFWIGSESTQDEYGTAAYKTVELDDFLEGKATQYRETEGNESRAFKKLFKSITIMPGGIGKLACMSLCHRPLCSTLSFAFFLKSECPTRRHLSPFPNGWPCCTCSG